MESIGERRPDLPVQFQGQPALMGPLEIRIVAREANRLTLTERISRARRRPILPGEGNGDYEGRLFSDDEEAIISALQGGPLPLQTLIVNSYLDKNKCAILAENLTARGVLEKRDEQYWIVPTKRLRDKAATPKKTD